jgi:hypothetical protein
MATVRIFGVMSHKYNVEKPYAYKVYVAEREWQKAFSALNSAYNQCW